MAARIINAGNGQYPGVFILQFDIDRASGEIDTGFDFKQGDVIRRVYIDVQTLEATSGTKTIDVGLLSSESGGDADGLLDGVSTAAAGLVAASATATDGTNQNFWAAAPTLGALLRSGRLGSDLAGDAGAIIPVDYVVGATAKSLTYTLGAAHTELVAKGYVEFFRSPQRIG